MQINLKRRVPAIITGSVIVSLALVGTAFAAEPGEFDHGRPPMGINATTTVNGMPMHRPGRGLGRKPDMRIASNTPSMMMQGNGQPVIGGSVTTVNGNTLTVTTKSGIVYTVDVSSAKIQAMGAASAVSNIAVGDSVMMQGTVNGTSVTASSLVDQGTASITPGMPNQNGENPNQGEHKGFMGAIGGFFSHMFGFF